MADLELSLREFLKQSPRNDDEMHAYADKLGMSPHDLETKVYGIAYKALSGEYFKHGDDDDKKFDADELAQGAEVEKEHTDDEDLAIKIAKAHLAEFPDYYSRLKDMETKAKQEKQEGISPQHYPLLSLLKESGRVREESLSLPSSSSHLAQDEIVKMVLLSAEWIGKVMQDKKAEQQLKRIAANVQKRWNQLPTDMF